MGSDHTYRYVNATNVYNKGKADGGACTLLWTNPNPNNAFAAQTLNIDLTNYNGVLIQSVWYQSIINANGTPTQFASQASAATEFSINYRWKGISDSVITNGTAVRPISINNNNIIFGIGRQGSTSDNGYCVPWRIYGIRGADCPTKWTNGSY